jgi:hypothetical protein
MVLGNEVHSSYDFWYYPPRAKHEPSRILAILQTFVGAALCAPRVYLADSNFVDGCFIDCCFSLFRKFVWLNY